MTVLSPTRPARGGGRGDFGGIVRSEWTKLRSVRSTYWTLAAASLCCIGFGALAGAIDAHHYGRYSAAQLTRELARNRFDATAQSLSGTVLAELALGVLGVLVISSEYRNRMIRTSLAAVPRRAHLLLGKLVAFGGLALVVAEVVAFAAFFGCMGFLRGPGLAVSLGEDGVLRAVAGTGLFLALTGLLGLGVGLLVRHTAGAITALVGLLLVLPALASALPHPWENRVGQMLPLAIAEQTANVRDQGDGFLAPGVGLAVMALYAAVALTAGVWLLRRRDA